ncbi:MAG: REP-associated tyrosine transposase [Candidatus Anammoxibacter sp.]
MKPYSINDSNAIYFCTDTIISFAFVFVEREFFEIIIDSFKFCQKEKGLKIHAFVIMPNHIHTVISANHKNLSGVLRDYKQFTSRKITETLRQYGRRQLLTLFQSAAENTKGGNHFKVWQSGSHPKLMDYDQKLFQKIEYVHNNPVRKGYVDKSENWLYSSARNYIVRDNSIIEIECLWQ